MTTRWLPDPADAEEFSRRYAASSRQSGLGRQAKTFMPCPFCAYPNFVAGTLIELAMKVQEPHTCLNCGRSARMVPNKQAPQGLRQYRVIQLGGDAPPPWMPPVPREDPDAVPAPELRTYALEFHRRCDAYDARVCTFWNKRGPAPSNGEEHRQVNGHTLTVLRELAARGPFDERALRSAIALHSHAPERAVWLRQLRAASHPQEEQSGEDQSNRGDGG